MWFRNGIDNKSFLFQELFLIVFDKQFQLNWAQHSRGLYHNTNIEQLDETDKTPSFLVLFRKQKHTT